MSARTFLVALLAVLLLIAVACGGGAGNKDRGRRHNQRAEGRPRNVLRLSRRAVERLWEGAA